PFFWAAQRAPASSGVSGMALGGGHALRSGRLRKPERAPPARVLHHCALGNFGIHAGTEEHYRGDRTLFGEIAADAGRWSDEGAVCGRSRIAPAGFVVVAAGTSAESWPHRRCAQCAG